MLYANKGEQELRVVKLDFKNNQFSGYYKSLNDTKHYKTDESISDYEFYDNDTKVGESFTIEELKQIKKTSY